MKKGLGSSKAEVAVDGKSVQADTRRWMESDRLTIATFGIFMILLLHLLVWASNFLIPVTAAILGYFVLNRPRRWLERIGVRPVFSATIFTTILSLQIALLLVELSTPATEFIEDLPSLMEQIKEKLITGPDGPRGTACSSANDIAPNCHEFQAFILGQHQCLIGFPRECEPHE